MANLGTLQPWIQPYAKYLLAVGRQYDPKLVVTSARRSPRKQYELYQKYLSGQSRIPANRPGTSLHEHGVAFDLARIGVDPLADPLLAWLGRVWESWGGRHGGERDPVHFQPRM